MYKEKLAVNGEYKKIFLFLISLSCFLFSIGCGSPFSSEDYQPSSPDGKGSFSLTLSDTARTILPATPSFGDFALYNLAFTPINDGEAASADRTNATISTEPIFLAPGTYNLVVNAYSDNNKTRLAAQGTLENILITAGEKTTANITLKALLSGGAGTFNWDISIPPDVTSAKMTIAPGSTDGSAQEAITLNAPKASGSRTLNSGQYNVTINLGNTGGETVVWKELLYVYRNLESVFNFTFTDAHFSGSIYTVTFNVYDVNPWKMEQSVLHGDTIKKPADPTRIGYIFSGWYASKNSQAYYWDFNEAVIESLVLNASWDKAPIIVHEDSLAAKLAELQTTAQTGGSYVFEVKADENITAQTLEYDGKSDITITLKSDGINRTITPIPYYMDPLFNVGSGVTLVLDDCITLKGVTVNGNVNYNGVSAAVIVSSGGTLIMNAGSSIISGQRGVDIEGNGAFIMNGGIISDTSSGVRMGYNAEQAEAIFTMNGGTITNGSYGVEINSGVFTMNGGVITGNRTIGVKVVVGTNAVPDKEIFSMYGGTISDNRRGGVSIFPGVFNMRDGAITGNGNNSDLLGGVESTDFIMSGGTISNNTNSNGGGGVNTLNFTMSGGIIANNTTNGMGGGVYAWGDFTMSGGTISGNTAGSYGGGVSAHNINKTGGTITGYGSDKINGNKVVIDGAEQNYMGHAVFAASRKRKETSAGPDANLYSNYFDQSFSGAWDMSAEGGVISIYDISANGSATETTTRLTFIFNKDIDSFKASNISLSGNTGAIKGALTRTGTGVYELDVSGIKASGMVSVKISLSGYTFSSAYDDIDFITYKTWVYYCEASAVSAAFNSLTANGSQEETTTRLTLTFDRDIPGFSASCIALTPNNTGAIPGALTRIETGVYELAVNGVCAEGEITLGVRMDGCTFTPSVRTVNVSHSASGNLAGLASIAFAQITDNAPYIDSGITIYRSSKKSPTSATFTAVDPSQYGSITWYINGTEVKGQGEFGESLTAHSMNYNYYSVGEHFLTLEVVRDGRTYSKRVTFNIAN